MAGLRDGYFIGPFCRLEGITSRNRFSQPLVASFSRLALAFSSHVSSLEVQSVPLFSSMSEPKSSGLCCRLLKFQKKGLVLKGLNKEKREGPNNTFSVPEN